VERDKNHPSVIMYSLANEANTHEEHALDFFEGAFAHARQLTDLPLMIVEYVSAEVNRVAHLADVIGINRYHGWYTDFGDLSVIDAQIKNSINSYVDKFQKPVVLTEFGADTIAGLHTLPAQAFSEEFQNEFIETYLNAIENLSGCVGTHLWNFADFQTKQGLTRVNGNKKGVFTRNRQPKWIAHTLRKRWTESK
ncbi:MAG TPA: glycoside hydrolase family 2 TIM barrel-domain containing protein, partial [Acholeplasmataceae bacterium]|nr:glycoside hydrolase family 2 TIM barrel-domain containing protein [Acholeplasmataceae bacterium]